MIHNGFELHTFFSCCEWIGWIENKTIYAEKKRAYKTEAACIKALKQLTDRLKGIR